MAALLWGNHWDNKLILVHCDDQAVVDVINLGSSKEDILITYCSASFIYQFFTQVPTAQTAIHYTLASNGPSGVSEARLVISKLVPLFQELLQLVQHPPPGKYTIQEQAAV